MALPDSAPGLDVARRRRLRLVKADHGALTADELGAALIEMRAQLIAEQHRAFPVLSVEDLEDLYGEASVDALRGRFADAGALRSYVRTYLRHRAITLKRSPRIARDAGTIGEHHQDRGIDPCERVIERELVAVLHEFLAEQSEHDRTVVWLLAGGQRPAQIAGALRIPRAQATADCKRLRSSLERFVALQTRPAAICARRREDVLSWQQTGRMPLALRWHLRWHHGCALAVRDAREAVEHALVPLLPAAAALPHVGLMARAWQALVTNRVTSAAHDGLARVRRLAPAGGGSAAAGAGAIKAVAIIGAGVAAVHAVTASPSHPHHDARPRIVAHAAGDTTTAPVVTTPVVSTPAPVPPTTTSTMSTTSTTTTAAAPVAPDGGASTPPSTVGYSSTTTTTAAQQTESPVSPSGESSSASSPGAGGGGGTGSSLGAGSTPP